MPHSTWWLKAIRSAPWLNISFRSPPTRCLLAYTSLSVLYQKKGMIPEAEAEANKARILGWKQHLKKT